MEGWERDGGEAQARNEGGCWADGRALSAGLRWLVSIGAYFLV